jgi:hypothetical protein|tara:strand:- start:4154 stop:4405 length:252 start_codon:yes stop_codon:yes gene_type:complete
LCPRQFQCSHIHIESTPKLARDTAYQKSQFNSLIVQEITVSESLIILLGHSNQTLPWCQKFSLALCSSIFNRYVQSKKKCWLD